MVQKRKFVVRNRSQKGKKRIRITLFLRRNKKMKITEEKVVAYIVEVEDGTGGTMEFRYRVFRDAFEAYQRAKNNNPKMRMEEFIYRDTGKKKAISK